MAGGGSSHHDGTAHSSGAAAAGGSADGDAAADGRSMERGDSLDFPDESGLNRVNSVSVAATAAVCDAHASWI